MAVQSQAWHRAHTHRRLVDGLAPAMAATGAYWLSTWRPQIDCSRVSGPCADPSKHSVPGGVAEAADLDAPGISKSDVGFWRRFAALVEDPCIEWAGPADANHFELQMDRPGCSGSAAPAGRPAVDRRTLALVAVAAVALGLALS